jgi:hypothetical protein
MGTVEPHAGSAIRPFSAVEAGLDALPQCMTAS